MTREAHAFLHEHGCINTGVISNEPPQEASKLSNEELAWRTRRILKAADMQVQLIMSLFGQAQGWCCSCSMRDQLRINWHMLKLWDSLLHQWCQVTTEKMIRKQLTEETGEDMAPRKAFIKDQATTCLMQHCSCSYVRTERWRNASIACSQAAWPLDCHLSFAWLTMPRDAATGAAVPF
jgi:DEK C terminal domain